MTYVPTFVPVLCMIHDVCTDVRSTVSCKMHETTDAVFLIHFMVHVKVLTSILSALVNVCYSLDSNNIVV